MNTKSPITSWYQPAVLGRNDINRLLSLSIAFSCLMVLARIVYTGRLTFIFLIWNLFLAWLPYLVTNTMRRRAARMSVGSGFICWFVVWLLLIPNSFYIITDLFHLNNQSIVGAVPQWFDLALILSFTWNGLLLGVLSVRQMEKMVKAVWPSCSELIFVYPIMWLNALGVYVGRWLRFNSWDVVTNPFSLVRDIGAILVHPIQYRFAWAMIMCYSVFMTLIYLTLKKLSRAIH